MKPQKISINEDAYPENLKNIFKPPRDLFVAGRLLKGDSEAIAIVGTRRATYYGLEQCEKISYELAIRGVTIVSGMAIGIDTAAHRGALRAKGRTIAVLGSGHNHIYPPENKKLYVKIAENGAVISEFPAETLPFSGNFPKRNRIISGLSKGVIVIEAPKRSGALITANFALEQGREVFAMPGNVNSAKSSGTNALIKEGAKLVENVEDVLEELKYVIGEGVTSYSSTVDPSTSLPSTSSGLRRAGGPLSTKPLVSPEEKIVFDILNEKPKAVDEISRTVALPVAKVLDILFHLELKKLARALPGNNFIRI